MYSSPDLEGENVRNIHPKKLTASSWTKYKKNYLTLTETASAVEAGKIPI